MSEIGLGYRIKAEGADETIQKLRQLHEEVRQGTKNAKDYRQEHKELTLSGRAAVGEFNDIKNAISAANPNLLEFTRTMSIFGNVSSTAMSVMNAINLAMIAGSQVTQELASAQRQAASDYNDYVRELAAFGPYDPRTQAAYQKWKGDLNQITNLQKQQAVQSVDTAITTIVSATAIAGSISQSAIAVKAIQWDRVFAGIGGALTNAMGSVVWFGGAVMVPLAVAVAAFYGAYYLIRALNPMYAKSMDELSSIIQNNWHADAITATMIAPFVGAYLGFARIEDQITEQLFNFINEMINAIDTLPDAVNKAFGRIVIPRLDNILPPGFANNGQNTFYNQAIKDLNINKNSTSTSGSGVPGILGSYISSGPTADEIKQQLEKSATSGEKIATNSTGSLAALAGIGSDIISQNETLHLINSGVAGLLQPLIDQKNVVSQTKDSINTQIHALKQQIADLSSQPQTALQRQNLNPDGLSQEQSLVTPRDAQGNYYTLVSAPSDAAKQLSAAKNQLASLQSAVSGLDNFTSGLSPVLNSIGLNSDTGIGSIISQALGNAAGIGGAGISAGELQQFANTHDFGIFTKAAIRDSATHTPTQQEQIDALLNAYKKSGLTGYTASDAARALGYGGAVSGGSNNYSNTGGKFGGLPGQYGQPSITVNVHNAGSVLSNQSLKDVIHTSVKDALQLGGW